MLYLKKQHNLITYILASVFITFMITVFLPGELYYGNISEMTISVSNWMKISYVGTIIELVILIGIGMIISQMARRILTTIYMCIGVGGYVQVLFLNRKLLLLDGQMQSFDIKSIIVNVMIWLVVITAIICLSYYEVKKDKHILAYVALCIFLIQLSTHVTVRLTTPIESTNDYTQSTDGMLELASHDNIVVFVLDWFDGQIMDAILWNEPTYTEPLHDFTYYSNCTSRYAYTNMGIPYLLTGVECVPGIEANDYQKYAFEKEIILQKISDRGYDIRVYTDEEVIPDSAGMVIDNYVASDSVQKVNLWNLFVVQSKASLYRMVPLVCKQYFAFDASYFADCILSEDVKYDCYCDIPFHDALCNEGVTVDYSYDGAYRVYHLYGAHVGPTMNENCEPADGMTKFFDSGRGALKIVYQYIEDMKETGIYNDATIIITADHGQNYSIDQHGYDALMSLELYSPTSNPILYVKLPQESHDELNVSDSQVSHTEVVATIARAAGVNVEEIYGKCVDEIPEDAKRDRTMTVLRSDVPWQDYVISGNVRDVESWSPSPIYQVD